MTTNAGSQYSRGNWMDAMAWMDAGKTVTRVGSGRRLQLHAMPHGLRQLVPTYFCQYEKEEEGPLTGWTDWHPYALRLQ